MSQQKLYKQLIEKYKCYPFLWDSNNKLYRIKSERENAWREISRDLQLPISELKSKMKTLMGTFRSERSREKKSRAAGSTGRYKSKWFLYAYFDFLTKKDTTVKIIMDPESQDVMEEGEGNEPPTSTQDITSYHQLPTNTFQRPNTISSRLTTKKVQKKKQVGADPELQVLDNALRMLRSSSKIASESHYTYGQYLVNELIRYDPSTLSCVKRAISEIMFEADVGTIGYKFNYRTSPQAQSPQLISASSSQERSSEPSAYQIRIPSLPPAPRMVPPSPNYQQKTELIAHQVMSPIPPLAQETRLEALHQYQSLTDVQQELPITTKVELFAESCSTAESTLSQQTENHLESGTVKEETEYLDETSTETSLEPNTSLDVSQIAALEEDPLCVEEPKTKQIKQSDRSPVQFEKTRERDPIDDFFQAMATSVKALPPLFQLQVKQKVTQAVFEAESEMLSMN